VTDRKVMRHGVAFRLRRVPAVGRGRTAAPALWVVSLDGVRVDAALTRRTALARAEARARAILAGGQAP
jgi:hypothetical protein